MPAITQSMSAIPTLPLSLNIVAGVEKILKDKKLAEVARELRKGFLNQFIYI